MLFFQTLFAQSVQKKTYLERWTRYARAHRNKSNDAEWRSGLIRYFACIGDDGKRKKGKGAAKWRRRRVRRSKYFKSSSSFELKRLRNHSPLAAILSAVIALPITFALHSTDWFEYPQLFRPPSRDFRPAMNLQELSREFEIAAPILLAGLERELREPLMTR